MILYFVYIVLGTLIFIHVLDLFMGWRSSRYGTAKILNWHPSLLWFNKGLVIDGERRISVRKSNQHLLLCSPTGVGKTTVYTFSNLLKLDHSMCVTDVKGELYEVCSGYLEQKGFTIRVLDLENIGQSVLFNPLKRIQTEDEIKSFASSLFQMAADGSKTESIWRNGAINLIEVLIRCLMNTENQKYANLANIIYLLNSIDLTDNAKRLDEFVAQYAPDDETFDKWSFFLKQEEKIKAGQLSGAQNVLSPFDTKNIKLLTQNDSIDFSELRDKKTCLFLKVPVGKSKEFAPILTLFYGQLFDHLLTDKIDASSQNVFFLLEEFGNLLRISNFSQVVSLIRSKRVSLSIICQDIEQIDHIYGSSVSQTITSNCGSFVVFPGIKSERTHRVLELLLGTATYHEEDESGNIHVNARKTMDAFEVRTMKKNRGLYIYNDLPAIKLRMKPIFKNKMLMFKAGIKSRRGRLIPTYPPVIITPRENEKVEYVPLPKVSKPKQEKPKEPPIELPKEEPQEPMDLRTQRLNELLNSARDT